MLGTNHQGTLRINSKNNDENTKARFIILKFEYFLHGNLKSIKKNQLFLINF